MPSPKTTSIVVAFHGDDVHKIIDAHYDVVRKVWEVTTGLVDASVKVHISPRITDSEPLHWVMDIASPTGRRTLNITQRRPAGPVIFANA